MNDHYQKIWDKIAEIPYGSVATYGQIADLVGLPKHARMVGYALRNTPANLQIPWHRVINARGEPAFPVDSDSYRRQRQLLEDEGVTFIGGRVPLKQYRWSVSLDELLWKP